MPMQLDIPEEELKQFQPYLRVYPKRATIIREGQIDDLCIFLLRQGEVEVYKQVGDARHSFGVLKAINFFGELAVVRGQPRAATVVAASDPAAVYAFENPNLIAMLSNPKWGRLLIGRLADNLGERIEGHEQLNLQLDRLRTAASQALGGLLALQAAAANEDAGRGAQLFADAAPQIIAAHLAEMSLQPSLPDVDQLDRYRRRGYIAQRLYELALLYRGAALAAGEERAADAAATA